jgi:tetratricopeptide (TPR) repeat protein
MCNRPKQRNESKEIRLESSAFRSLLSSICYVFFSLAVLLSPVQARSNSASRAYNEGVQLFNQKDCNGAVARFDEAISSDPDFSEALYARGACKYYLKSLHGSLMDLNSALRLNSQNLEARALRGAVQYEMDQWDGAVRDFDYVLERDGSDAQALLGRGIIRLKREELPGAKRDFQNFLRVRPNDPMADQVRKVLTSLEGAQEAPGRAPRTSRSPARRAAPIETMPDLENTLSDAYLKKVLRGENAQAVGDIRRAPSASVGDPN